MGLTNRFPVLRRILKIFLIGMAIVFLVFGIVTWVVVKKKNDWLYSQIQSYVQESQSGELAIASIDLKLFRNFPRVTLELSGITYYEHPDSIRAQEEQPILKADQLFVALDLLPLINDELKIEAVSISNGEVSLIEYPDGLLNIQRALKKPSKLPAVKDKPVTKPAPISPKKESKEIPPAAAPKAGQALQVQLESIGVNNILVTLNSLQLPPSVIHLKEVEVDIVHEENIIQAKVHSEQSIRALIIDDIALPPGELSFETAVGYEPETKHLTLKEGSLIYNDFKATLRGEYSHSENFPLDISVDASSNDLEILSVLLKPEVLRANPSALKQGDIYLRGRVFGELKTQPPQFDFTFGVKDLNLKLPKQAGTFSDIGFNGHFTSGAAADFSKARIEVTHLKGNLPGGYVRGNFRLENFVSPDLQYDLHAQLTLDNFDQIFQIEAVQNLKGSVAIEATFDGPVKQFARHRMDSSRSSSLVLNNLSFTVARTKKQVSGLSGKIENRNNQVSFQDLTLTYDKNDLRLNAVVDNFMYFLFSRENEIKATGSVQSKQLFTRDFILDTLRSAQIQEQVRDLSFDFQLSTSVEHDSARKTIPGVAFAINNLSARFEELPDIRLLNAAGHWRQAGNGPLLVVEKFKAVLPQGTVTLSGDLQIPEKGQWQFNAQLALNKFPWIYVTELADEIKEGVSPHAKNLASEEMDLISANLDLSASIITYPFDIHNLVLRKSHASYSIAHGETISANNIDLALEQLLFLHPENSGNLTGVKAMEGTVDMRSLKLPGLQSFDISMNMSGESNQLNFELVRTNSEVQSQTGFLAVDLSQKELAYHLQMDVKQIKLDYFIGKVYPQKLMSGFLDYSLDLKTSGSTWPILQQNLAGTIEVAGKDLWLYGVDVDDVLQKYKESQNFNLTDLGAVVVAGPVGLVITKGSDFISLSKIRLDSTQQTKIENLFTGWKYENNQLITEDVAFATPLNRIAFDGRIDFATDSIPGLVIAVVDKNGCSLIDQNLFGSMKNIQHGKVKIAKTLFGSVINFVNAVVGKDCKPIYTGRVPAPVRK